MDISVCQRGTINQRGCWAEQLASPGCLERLLAVNRVVSLFFFGEQIMHRRLSNVHKNSSSNISYQTFFEK